jgi:spore coat polysaccharide biosynthesis predicted glycosyltransferase SpsG
MTRAIFLVDTGPTIGLGHLSRSLVLLAALERRGVACRLYCTDPAAAQSLSHSAAAIPLKLSDLPRTDLVVCDSYRLEPGDYTALRGQTRLLAALDDTAERPLPVDVVINHNLYAPRLAYSRVSAGKVLAGADYALVNDQVMAAARTHAARAPDNAVAMSFGGTDDGTISAGVARALLTRTDARLDVIVAASRTPSAAIRELATTQPGRVLLHHGPDVPALLARARLYVGAAGMMSFEAFAIGLHLVVVPIADNQRPGAEALVAYGHAMLDTVDAVQLAEIAARRLRTPPNIAPSPIDGKGPDRLAAALLQELSAR